MELEQAITDMDRMIAEIKEDQDSYFDESIFQGTKQCTSIIKNAHRQKITSGYRAEEGEVEFIQINYDVQRADKDLLNYLAEQLHEHEKYQTKMRDHLLNYQGKVNSTINGESDIKQTLSSLPDDFRNTYLPIAKLLVSGKILLKGRVPKNPKTYLEDGITNSEKKTAEYQVLHDATTYGVKFFENILTYREGALSGEEQERLGECIAVAKNINDVTLNLLRCAKREHDFYIRVKDLLCPAE